VLDWEKDALCLGQAEESSQTVGPRAEGHSEQERREDRAQKRAGVRVPASSGDLGPGKAYFSSARTFLASSLPAKLTAELTAAARAFRAASLSPTLRDASPKWY